MARTLKILAAGCLLAALTLLNSIAEARTPARSPAKSTIGNAVQAKKIPSRATQANAQLLTLAKKAPLALAETKPAVDPTCRRPRRRTYLCLNSNLPTEPARLAAAPVMLDSGDDDDSDDSDDAPDIMICAN